MTPEEWEHCTDPSQMVRLLKGRAGERQVRLLLCACGRALWARLADGRSRKAVEVGERFADEPGDEGVLGSAYREATAALLGAGAGADVAALAKEAVDRWVGVGYAVTLAGQALPRRSVADLLREIFNPFRPVALDPAWLAWNGGAARQLARAVYEERSLPSGHLDATRLAVLADMLEEAGCADPHVLGHLRGPGPHVRGCFAVDAVLGKA